MFTIIGLVEADIELNCVRRYKFRTSKQGEERVEAVMKKMGGKEGKVVGRNTTIVV